MKQTHFNYLMVLAIALLLLASPYVAINTMAGCSTGHPDPMPVPTDLSVPSSGNFSTPFTTSWTHVWTGCGGYELEYRRVGDTVWSTVNVPSGSTIDVNIRRPDGLVSIPASYELRVRSYWGSSCDERFYSEYSISTNIEMYCPGTACSTGHPDPMPVPINLSVPSSVKFSTPFTASWDHVWTGCGGYELEYRRVGDTVWSTVNVPSGSTIDVNIRRPDGMINHPTTYELRVRSYWGSGCNQRFYSNYSSSVYIDINCIEDIYLSCSTGHPVPMPAPANLLVPSSGYFSTPFTASWDHVWTGCGGYEFEYRRAGETTWITIDVPSGSSIEAKIRRPDGHINIPTSYELRVRSYWGGGCDERFYSEYSMSANIEMYCPGTACSTGHPDPMPVPNWVSVPGSAYYGETFIVSWSHVWTGCGGYELEYRCTGVTTWTKVDVASGSTVDLKIRRPDGPLFLPATCELRVRSYWGSGCDERFYSAFSALAYVDMGCQTLSSISDLVSAHKIILRQNCPNPFNPQTTITFNLPSASRAELTVYDVQGRLVKMLVDQELGKGENAVIWNAKNDSGEPVTSGVYFYRLKVGNAVLTRKMVLMQ